VGDTIKMQRPPFPEPVEDDPSGCVRRDDRGNAIWQWKDDETLNQALVHPSLTVVEDDAPSPTGNVKTNVAGPVKGYDPYASGIYAIGGLANRERPRKKNLRELSKWIEMKRRMDGSRDVE
jgi:hypothetical protein